MENIYKFQKNCLKNIKLTSIVFIFILSNLLFAKQTNAQTSVTFPPGSFIVNMGVYTYNRTADIKTQLKPYGMIYELIKNYNVPVYWVINPAKAKDGTDFTYNGINFKGGTFVINGSNITVTVQTRILYWMQLGVVGTYTTSSLTLSTNYKFTSVPLWTLDHQNGQLTEDFFINAGIPSSAYNSIDPENLGACNDVFVLPHADPNWSSHANLYNWNLTNKGAIWAGCHAVSALETIFNPDDKTQQQNYLTEKSAVYTGNGHFADNTLIRWSHHKNATPPYTTTNPIEFTFPTNFGPKLVSPSDPVAQFMGVSDLAHKNGSEQVFLPVKNGGWRATTKIVTYDPTQENIPVKSNGPAAIIAYGRGFGDENRGWVMYEAGHSLNKGTVGDVPAQRAFFNWSFMSGHDKSPTINAITGIPADGRFKSQPYPQKYPLSANYFSPISAGINSVTWSCTRSDNGVVFGTFTANGTAAAINTMFTPSITYDVDVECVLTVKIVDQCGRVCFDTYPITVTPVPRVPVPVADYGFISATCAIQGYSAVVNALNNDYDPDGDVITITEVTGAFPADGTWSTDGTKIYFLPTYNFFGPTSASYTICDKTPPGPPFYGPLCATSTVAVGVGAADDDGCYPGSAYGLESNARIPLINLMSQSGTGALVTGTALNDVEDTYNALNINYLNLGKDKSNYLVLSTGKILRAKDVFNIGWSKAATGTATISVQIGKSATGPWTDSQTFTISVNGSGSTVSNQSIYTIPAGVNGITYVRISAGTYPSNNSAVDVWLDGIDYDYYNCIPAIPEAYTDKVDVHEDIPKIIDVIYNDVNPGNLPLTLTVTSPPTNGKISINTNNTITYITNTDYPTGGNATDAFTYLICNTQGLCASGLVEITLIDDGCSGTGQFIPPGTLSFTVTYQEGTANTVEDSYIKQDDPTINYGLLSTLKVGKKPYNSLRPFFRFNQISTIPAHADVQSAVFSIYETASSDKHGTNISYSLHQLNEAWTETGATWYNRNVSDIWAATGGTYITPAFNTTIQNTSKNSWKSFNITNMVQQWVKTAANGGADNNGFIFKQTNENTTDINCTFASSEYSTSSRRPKLVITYIIPPWLCEAIPNRAPLANPDRVSTLSSSVVDIPVLLNDADPDGNPISINSLIGPFEGGNAVISGNKIIFTPNGYYTGLSAFKYVVQDNSGLKDTAFIYVTVNNAPPVTTKDDLIVLSNSSGNASDVQANDVNPDGPSPLSTSVVTPPNHGTATVSGVNIMYTPYNDYTGPDTLTYSVCEPLDPEECTGLLVCDENFLYITVQNRPPVPVNDELTMPPCFPFVFNIIANDYDPEHDMLHIQNISPLSNPSTGTLVNNGDGTVTFTPDTGFIGNVTFTYSLIDDGNPNAVSATPATVTIHVVNPENNPPVATDDDWHMNIGGLDYITVLDNDFDPDNQALTNPEIILEPLHGIVNVMPNGSFEFVPNSDYHLYGIDSIKYRIFDIVLTDFSTCTSSLGMSDEATLIIHGYITNINPVLNVATPPSGRAICNDYYVSATITPGMGGGIGATDLYEYSINNGLTWDVYASGQLINTSNAIDKILIRTSRSGGLYGQPTGPIIVAAWPVASPTVFPTIVEALPQNGTAICTGFSAAAVIAEGTGGSYGAADKYEYSIDNGNSWMIYISGSPILTTAAALNVKIRISRSGGDYGCQNLYPVTAIQWPVYPTPQSPKAIVTQPTCLDPVESIYLTELPLGGWTLNPLNIYGSGPSTFISGIQPGIYSFSVKVDTSGCVSPPTTVVINPHPLRPAPVVVYGGTTQCGGTVTLTAEEGTGGIIYWQDTVSDGISTAEPITTKIVTQSGNYYFRALSSEGCWGDVGMAEVVIVNNNTPYTPYELQNIQTILIEGGFVNTGMAPDWNQQNWCALDAHGQVVSLSLTPNDTTDVLIFSGQCLVPIIDINDAGLCRNLTLGNGATINLHQGNELNIKGDFFNNGVFNVEENLNGKGVENIFVEGDWNNEGGEFYCGKGRVVFNGTDVQRIDTRHWPFYDLEINKPGAKGDRVDLVEETTVINTLDLVSGQLNLNNNSLILENALPTAINRDAGYIYSETDPANINNIVKWNIGSTLDVYSVPFGKSSSEYIPLSVEIKHNFMDTSGYLELSTYGTPTSNLPIPVVVDHLGVDNEGGFLIVDRYWYIASKNQDAYNAGIEGEITFTYLESELDDILESGLIAQRYNPQPDSVTGVWADMIYSQNLFSDFTNHGFCVNIPIQPGGNTGTFKTSYVDDAQFFNVWTLSSLSQPLPIKLLSFKAKCNNDFIEIEWVTATETNNDFFTVESSSDGLNWKILATVKGAKNSSTEKYYSIIDDSHYAETTYYRLKQTDYNGISELFNTISIKCNPDKNENVFFYPNPNNGLLNIFYYYLKNQNIQIQVYNALGYLVENKLLPAIDEDEGSYCLNLTNLPDGIYFVKFIANDVTYLEKIIKKK